MSLTTHRHPRPAAGPEIQSGPPHLREGSRKETGRTLNVFGHLGSGGRFLMFRAPWKCAPGPAHKGQQHGSVMLTSSWRAAWASWGCRLVRLAAEALPRVWRPTRHSMAMPECRAASLELSWRSGSSSGRRSLQERPVNWGLARFCKKLGEGRVDALFSHA